MRRRQIGLRVRNKLAQLSPNSRETWTNVTRLLFSPLYNRDSTVVYRVGWYLVPPLEAFTPWKFLFIHSLLFFTLYYTNYLTITRSYIIVTHLNILYCHITRVIVVTVVVVGDKNNKIKQKCRWDLKLDSNWIRFRVFCLFYFSSASSLLHFLRFACR